MRGSRSRDLQLAAITCLWHGCLGTRTVRVILARDRSLRALVSTGPAHPRRALVNRYAARWSIEQGFHDARNTLGAGQAHNRTLRAVARTVPQPSASRP